LLYQAIIKVWSTFSKVVGVGKAHKYFPLMQSEDSQTAWLFAPDKLLYRKIFMGAAQTRKPLKRLDLNFLIIKQKVCIKP